MSERKLGVVKEIVEAAGMGIAHVYEDLVFLNHTAFLIQFTEESSRLLLRVNREAEQETTVNGGGYALAQDGDDSVRIEFLS